MNVSEVRVGVLDAAGTPIEVVYVKNAPSYAIYRTHQRVMVHLADDVTERGTQQEMLATLNPLRNEINALIDGWRTSPVHEKEALTRLYDRRVADALALAFEGNPTSAQALLKSTLDEISEERQSRGRIQHLLFAGGAVIVIAAAVLMALLIGGAKAANFLDNDVNALLFAAAVGAVGALASIAIAIQERRLATDLQPRDNISDAVLRIAVGAVGALLLIAMLRSDLINLNMRIAPDSAPAATNPSNIPGTATAAPRVVANVATPAGAPAEPAATTAVAAPTAGPAAPATAAGTATGAAGGAAAAAPASTASPGAQAPAPSAPQSATQQRIGKNRTTELLVMLVIAFFAGFTERLVSRLAERVQFREVAADLTPAKGQDRQPNGRSRGGAGRGYHAAIVPGPIGGIGAEDDPGTAEEDHADGCIADATLTPADLTDDSELPETTGGVVEQPRT